MTRTAVTNRINEINAIFEENAQREARNSKAYHETAEFNKNVIVEIVKTMLNDDTIFVGGRLDSSWYQDFAAFNFTFNSKAENDSTYEFRVDFNTKEGLAAFRTAGISARIGKEPATFGTDVAETKNYYAMVAKVLDTFNITKNAEIISNAIINRRVAEIENTEYDIQALRIERTDLEMKLKRIDLNIAAGTIVEYNDTYWSRGRELNNWITVRVTKVTPSQVAMTRIYEKDGTWTDSYDLRKKMYLHKFRSVEEGNEIRAAEIARREKWEAERRARYAAVSA